MLVFHRKSCPSCLRLAREVRDNQKVIKLSKHFVMVSCDGNEPNSELFTFDGNYFPRVFFVYPNNTIDFQFVSNPLNFQYRYFYRGADHLIGRMKDFLKLLKEEHSSQINSEKQEEVEL
ncbi:uncharacterized protein [Blastocystis hominis]|uniref:Thioredoxin domain-containing protein n=1 Tax=Blastocystis hominis TaxID=12968 RepID=D8M242_BLAHO|nr:uncharacterized protein [Blastocystis hominis]CBK22131.2 unnamed protein product [Blastocystis hominis]|eukprot:XP_012896179.1 uncharacterized protein [Blastocystis hominis]